MSTTYTIETAHLRKEYSRKVAVADLDLQVGQGEVFGFLGPNGAGKTTSIKMLLGLAKPTSGEARLLGQADRRSAIPIARGLLAGALPLSRLAERRRVPESTRAVVQHGRGRSQRARAGLVKTRGTGRTRRQKTARLFQRACCSASVWRRRC